MGYREEYQKWCKDPVFDEATRNEVLALTDEKEIEDRFYKTLEFGTAGLRGVIGAGTNRMNFYVVGKATLGLAEYLSECVEGAKEKGVAIAYDTRNYSKEFAVRAAEIFTACGIRAYLFDQPAPIPLLSYTVREKGCCAGVVVTASHNPPQYNGYKAYDENGCQLGVEAAKAVLEKVNAIPGYDSIPQKGNKNLLTMLGDKEIRAFTDRVKKESVFHDGKAKAELKIVYTPVHGSGNVPVRQILEKDGFSNVFVVKEQKKPDGNFPTVKSPNPEDRSTLLLGIEEAKKRGADLVIGTDPDADRVGCAVKKGGDYELITGNQIGALLVDFLFKAKQNIGKKPVVIKTVVTSDLGAAIAEKHGAEVIQVLTGFRFIGEKITEFENAKKAGDETNGKDYLIGYEESYGYLVGTHARDKDSVVASMLIAEMTAYYKKEGKTLIDALEALYQEYGYYLDVVDSFTLQGKEGLERIAAIMSELRAAPSVYPGQKEVLDYKDGLNGLPPSNVLKFILQDGTWIVARPSGTEPKLKFYYGIKAENRESASALLEKLRKTVYEAKGLKK